MFRDLDTAFSLFYDTTGSQTVLKRLRDALIVGGSLAIALVASVAIGLVSTVLTIIPRGWLLGPVLLVVPLVVAFLPIYYVFPNTDVDLREVLPGVIVAAIGWAALQSVLHLYTNYAGRYLVYGVIGAVLLVLSWLYIAAFLLLIGAAVNVVLADRTPAALAGSPSRRGISADE